MVSIYLFIGMFGHGKTLSMTHRARNIYKKYGDSIRFYSNYDLKDIPYIPLINFNQLLEIGENDDSNFVGTVVLIDEVEAVLSHRNFANFPLELLSVLCQQRKRKLYIMSSSQRFFMCDKIWRSICTNVINCNKYWRFQHCEIYDAWQLEHAGDISLIKRKSNQWWFVKNNDFNCYDTSQMITRSSADDFVSNDVALIRKGLDQVVINTSSSPKKALKKYSKK